jgi:hypothetical protein
VTCASVGAENTCIPGVGCFPSARDCAWPSHRHITPNLLLPPPAPTSIDLCHPAPPHRPRETRASPRLTPSRRFGMTRQAALQDRHRRGAAAGLAAVVCAALAVVYVGDGSYAPAPLREDAASADPSSPMAYLHPSLRQANLAVYRQCGLNEIAQVTAITSMSQVSASEHYPDTRPARSSI